MKKIWIHKATSFQEAAKFEQEYNFQKTPEERLAEMQFLREQHHKLKGPHHGSGAKRLRRVFRIIRGDEIKAD